MKQLLFVLVVFLSCTACSDRFEVGNEIETTVYIQKNGLQEITLSAETPVYEMWLYKGGYNSRSCDVSLTVDTEDLVVYNARNKSDYRMLPGNCYEFDRETVRLTGDAPKACVTLTFDTSCIPADGKFLLPVRAVCPADAGAVSPALGVAYLKIRIEPEN